MLMVYGIFMLKYGRSVYHFLLSTSFGCKVYFFVYVPFNFGCIGEHFGYFGYFCHYPPGQPRHSATPWSVMQKRHKKINEKTD